MTEELKVINPDQGYPCDEPAPQDEPCPDTQEEECVEEGRIIITKRCCCPVPVVRRRRHLIQFQVGQTEAQARAGVQNTRNAWEAAGWGVTGISVTDIGQNWWVVIALEREYIQWIQP